MNAADARAIERNHARQAADLQRTGGVMDDGKPVSDYDIRRQRDEAVALLRKLVERLDKFAWGERLDPNTVALVEHARQLIAEVEA